jgi:hypothetical protein
MNFIDQNVSRENIEDQLAFFKQLVCDLEIDLGEQNNKKTQMDV